MESIEDKLKNLILSRYHSLLEFTQIIGMPYSTLSSMLKKGLKGASLTNVILICQELNISVDELGEGRITAVSTGAEAVDVATLLNGLKEQILTRPNLTFKGQTLDYKTREAIVTGCFIGAEVGFKNSQ